MKFVLQIELGNDAMERVEHIVGALRGVANRLEDDLFDTDCDNGYPQTRIRDANGLTVGHWIIE